jgi:hypothetical protein
VSAKRTPADEKSSTHRDFAAQEPREKFVIEFGRVMAVSARKCFDNDVQARSELAFAASLRTKFEELSTTHQNAVVNSAMQLRRNLTKAFEAWCATFQKQLCEYASNLCEVAQDPIWIAGQLADTCGYELEREAKCLYWLAMACTGEVLFANWANSGWLLAWPTDVTPSELALATLAGKGFESIEFEKRFSKSLELAQRAALLHTLGLISSEDKVRSAQTKKRPSDGTTPAVRRDKVSERLVQLMQSFPNYTYRMILGKYDDEGREVRAEWKKHGHLAMVSVYDCPKCRRNVERFMSRTRLGLGLPRAPKSSRP